MMATNKTDMLVADQKKPLYIYTHIYLSTLSTCRSVSCVLCYTTAMPARPLHRSRTRQRGISKTTKQATQFSKKTEVAHLSQQMTCFMNTATLQLSSFSKHFEIDLAVGKRSPSFCLSSLKLIS